MRYTLVLFLTLSSMAWPFSAQGDSVALTLSEVTIMALEKNGDMVVERGSLDIARAGVLRAEAAYEPAFRADVRFRERTDPVNSILSGAPEGEVAPTFTGFQTSASLVGLLRTGGSVSITSGIGRDETNSILALLTPSWTTLLGLEIRQPLLQNRRIDPTRRAIRVARADQSRAEASFRRMVTETTAAVERAYWAVVVSRREVEIRESSIHVALAQREGTKIRIEAGTQAESDLSQITAEVERRRGDLISSRESLIRAENQLRNLILRDASDPFWSRPIVPADAPRIALTSPNLPAAIERALQSRPELLELQQRLARQDVEIEAARDRGKPQLDVVASYVGRGLSGSRNPDALALFGRPVDPPDALEGNLGRSLGTLGENRFGDASIGLAMSIPIGNTAARQDVAIARAIRGQAEATLDQARQRVSLEVRNAAASLDSAAQRIEAAQAAVAAAEIQLQAERDRFTAGTTIGFFVLTRQNDLAAAQLSEIVALTDYRKALTEFARATGSLIEDRGIQITEAERR